MYWGGLCIFGENFVQIANIKQINILAKNYNIFFKILSILVPQFFHQLFKTPK